MTYTESLSYLTRAQKPVGTAGTHRAAAENPPADLMPLGTQAPGLPRLWFKSLQPDLGIDTSASVFRQKKSPKLPPDRTSPRSEFSALLTQASLGRNLQQASCNSRSSATHATGAAREAPVLFRASGMKVFGDAKSLQVPDDS